MRHAYDTSLSGECGNEGGLGVSYLDEVLALGFGDQRLELGSGEGVDKSGLGDDEQKHLGASQDGEFIRLSMLFSTGNVAMRFDAMDAGSRSGEMGDAHLFHDAGLAFGKSDVPTRLVLDKLDVNLATFATGSCLVVVIIIGCGADTRSLDTTSVGAIGVVWIIRAG